MPVTRGAAGKENQDKSILQRMGMGFLVGSPTEVEKSSSSSFKSTTSSRSSTSQKLLAEVKFEELMEEKIQVFQELELEVINIEADIFEKEDQCKTIEEELIALDPVSETTKDMKDQEKNLRREIRELNKKLKMVNWKISKVKGEIDRLPKKKILAQAIIESQEDEQILSDSEGSTGAPEVVKNDTVEWVDKHVESLETEEQDDVEKKREEFEDLVRRVDRLKGAEEVKSFDHRRSPPPQDNLLPVMTQVAQTLQLLQQQQLSAAQHPQDGMTQKFFARQSTSKDLPWFSGKPEEWPAFIAELENTTRLCQFSDAENMQRLRKCLKGDAAKAVQSLMISPQNLFEVVDTLRIRFGQSEHIIDSRIKKVRSSPSIRDDKLDTVIEFGTAVVNLMSTIKALKCDDHLNNPILMKELKDKLPSSYKMQWIEWVEADSIRQANLQEFTLWIKKKMTSACKVVAPVIRDDKKEEHMH
ncbi:Intraflagellar transport protein 81 [Folsomia candida]|uniref:Intraflagellar transport protein 81 n=1 Tax=Folsomia candida TaxID=158441 RepID=A0A226E8Q7_FOLCA|nr:Intraflagellar transport protein 81 [Folsomia candida]